MYESVTFFSGAKKKELRTQPQVPHSNRQYGNLWSMRLVGISQVFRFTSLQTETKLREEKHFQVNATDTKIPMWVSLRAINLSVLREVHGVTTWNNYAKLKTVMREINFFLFTGADKRKKLPLQWVVYKCSCKHLQKNTAILDERDFFWWITAEDLQMHTNYVKRFLSLKSKLM